MRDVLFVLVVTGFFALAALYVRACAAVVGSTSEAERSESDEDVEVAA